VWAAISIGWDEVEKEKVEEEEVEEEEVEEEVEGESRD